MLDRDLSDAKRSTLRERGTSALNFVLRGFEFCRKSNIGRLNVRGV